MVTHNLDAPDYNPPDCPAWAKETLPEFIRPYRGRNGLPSPYRERTGPLAMTCRGVDRYHANQFIVYRKETAKYLYSDYTPLTVNYRKGLLPSYEKVSAEVLAGCRTATEKAVALLVKGAARVKHPEGPPCGDKVPGDRNLDDEALLQSKAGWCNEQARVFIRLCQVSNIPARIVQLFYADKKTGHCIAEFYADGRWAMADATWFCVFPGPDGKLLSAVQCHDRGEGQQLCGAVYHKRFRALLAMSDAELNFGSEQKTAEWRAKVAAYTPQFLAEKMNCFAIINYPLPG